VVVAVTQLAVLRVTRRPHAALVGDRGAAGDVGRGASAQGLLGSQGWRYVRSAMQNQTCCVSTGVCCQFPNISTAVTRAALAIQGNRVRHVQLASSRGRTTHPLANEPQRVVAAAGHVGGSLHGALDRRQLDVWEAPSGRWREGGKASNKAGLAARAQVRRQRQHGERKAGRGTSTRGSRRTPRGVTLLRQARYGCRAAAAQLGRVRTVWAVLPAADAPGAQLALQEKQRGWAALSKRGAASYTVVSAHGTGVTSAALRSSKQPPVRLARE
jgi:hypothetical protein